MGELVDISRRFGELDASRALVSALVVMSAATMDRRLAPDSGAMVTLTGHPSGMGKQPAQDTLELFAVVAE